MAKSVQAAVAAYVSFHKSGVAAAAQVLEALNAQGVDVTKRAAIAEVVQPEIAKAYGVRLQAAERVSKNGGKVFPTSPAGKAAATCFSRLMADILGDSSGHKPAEPVKVTRAMVAAARDFVELCGGKKQALAAIKAAK